MLYIAHNTWYNTHALYNTHTHAEDLQCAAMGEWASAGPWCEQLIHTLNMLCLSCLLSSLFGLRHQLPSYQGLPRWLAVKNPPAKAGDAGSIPGSGRASAGGHGIPLQYPCLGNPTGISWRATVQGVAGKSDTTERPNSHDHNQVTKKRLRGSRRRWKILHCSSSELAAAKSNSNVPCALAKPQKYKWNMSHFSHVISVTFDIDFSHFPRKANQKTLCFRFKPQRNK